MDKSKYGKYIVTDVSKFKVEIPLPPSKATSGAFMFINDDVVKGSFFVRTFWFYGVPEGERLKPHTHDYDEVVAFFGTNMNDPHDLGGEIEFWIGGEKHIITKSSLTFIPKGLEHGPLHIKRVDSPIFHFTTGTAGKYGNRPQ